MTDPDTSNLGAAILLEQHHRRLDDLLDEVERLVDAENWKEAKLRFERFHRELEEHIRLEEEVMFPAVEAHAAMPHGPTVVMRQEHVGIRQSLMSVYTALTQERPISQTTTELEAQLGDHNFKEERVLYPMFERFAPGGIRTALAGKVEALLRGAA
jgi:iron-sulfur cluster repair protein YtfE (RIC family)